MAATWIWRAAPPSSSSTACRGPRTSRSSTSTPRSASRPTAQSDFTRLVGAASRAQARRLDGPLRRARRVPRRRVRPDGQKVLVVYTDGGDTRSTMTYTDVLTTLKASRRDGLRHRLPASTSPHSSRTEQRLQLQQIADIDRRPGLLPDVAQGNRQDLRSHRRRARLALPAGYVSSNTRTDGTWRPVEVRLKRADLRGVKIRTRKGYYAPFKAAGGASKPRMASHVRPLLARLRLRAARRSGAGDRRARRTASSAATRTRCCSASPARARRSPWPRSIARVNRPTLVMAHNKTLAAQLYQEFRRSSRTTPSSISSPTTTTTSPRPTCRPPTRTSRRKRRSTTRSTACGCRRRARSSSGAT